MAEELLDEADVGSVAVHPGGAGVADQVATASTVDVDFLDEPDDHAMPECQQIMLRPLKILFDPHSATDGKPLFNQDEANGYETGKFDRHNNTLIPAHALVRWWTKHSRHRRRLRARDLRAQFP